MLAGNYWRSPCEHEQGVTPLAADTTEVADMAESESVSAWRRQPKSAWK